MIASAELASVWLGLCLHLYELLREHGLVTVAELAGIDVRYAREWLEQQAVAGFLDVEPGPAGGPGQAAGEDWETRRFSWWHCLPASRAETPSAAAGTALRPSTVRRWAEQAGFAGVRELPVDHLFWRFYELRG